jgi:hypothetical protein
MSDYIDQSAVEVHLELPLKVAKRFEYILPPYLKQKHVVNLFQWKLLEKFKLCKLYNIMK